MLKKLRDNNEGIVLITVLLIIIVMTIITVSIISMNVSQVKSSEKEIKRLKAETLAQGAFAYTYANQLNDPTATTISLPSGPDIDGTTFSWESNLYTGQGLNNTSNVVISINYILP